MGAEEDPLAALSPDRSDFRLHEIAVTPSPRTPELSQRRWRVLVIASLGVFMVTLDSSILAVALPVMGTQLHLTFSEALWVQAAYILIITILVIPIGRMAERRGLLRSYALGVLLFGLFSVVAALSPGGLFLILARVFQGIGGALVLTTSAAIITAAFPPQERGRALGLNMMAATIGLTLGPPLGGLIVTHLGWRWIFLINAPVAVATLAGGWDLLGAERRDRANALTSPEYRARSSRIDFTGATLLGMLLAALFVPLIFSPLWGWVSGRTLGPLVAAAILLVLFVIVEGRVDDPILDLGLFRHNRVFAAATTASLLYHGASYGVTIFTAVFLEVVQGRSAQLAGLILLTQPAVMTCVTPFAGWLSDRFGSHGLSAVGMVVTAAGTGQLALATSTAPIWRIFAALATLGLGLSLFSSPNFSAIMGSVDRSHLGVASGVFATTRFCGQGISIAILGAIAASKLGPTGGRVILLGKSAGVNNAQAFAAGYREAMLVGAGLAIVGALISLVRERKPESQKLREPQVLPPL